MRSTIRRLPQYLPRVRALLVALLLSLAIVRPAAATDYTDLWYTAGENAWGVNFNQADNFLFATFFIYGPDQQPTWYTGQMNRDSNGLWAGPLYRSTGSYFGAPWSEAEKTIVQVGLVTFTPSSSYAGTLTYNVGGVNVAKVVSRLTLQTIALGGVYSGSLVSIFSSCNDPSLNGSVRSFYDMVVTQNATGGLIMDMTAPPPNNTTTCRMAGQIIQDGQLYRMPNGSYTCGTTFSSTVQMSEIKQTAQGIEGQWVAPISLGCIETAYFSAVLN
jgi:hypothetical protein